MPEFDPSKHYYGSPCKRGHSGMRFRTNQTCVICARGYARNYYEENRERCVQVSREWQTRNPARSESIKKRSRENCSESNRARVNAWRLANHSRHQETMVRVQAKRRAAKANAVPSWSDGSAVRAVYEKARELGGHVDHIVPLSSPVVCGLHCWENLQILSPDQNRKKSNTEWPDMPEVERDTERERNQARQHDERPGPPGGGP